MALNGGGRVCMRISNLLLLQCALFTDVSKAQTTFMPDTDWLNSWWGILSLTVAGIVGVLIVGGIIFGALFGAGVAGAVGPSGAGAVGPSGAVAGGPSGTGGGGNAGVGAGVVAATVVVIAGGVGSGVRGPSSTRDGGNGAAGVEAGVVEPTTAGTIVIGVNP